MATPSEARLHSADAAESAQLPNSRAKFGVWAGGLGHTAPKVSPSTAPVTRARFNRALIMSVVAPFLLMSAIVAVLLWSIRDVQAGRFT